MKIYRVTDKIPIKIDTLEFKISPLQHIQKTNIQRQILKAEQGDPMALMLAARLAVKYAVKEVTGITDQEDKDYLLEFENGELTDSCVDDLLNVDQDQKLSLVCMNLIQGIPKVPLDPEGNPIKGIKIGGNERKK
jgi:hypothetical protein